MRKMDPVAVKEDFSSGLDDLIGFYDEAFVALHRAGQRTFLAENTLLSAAVLWEGFISDLVIAYINRDSSRFSVHLRASVESALKGKQHVIYSRFANLNIPVHLSKSDIIDLIDEHKSNIAFSKYSDLQEAANRWLIANHARKFTSLTAPQKATVDALIAVRNHIAHRSDRSAIAMNDVLHKGELHITGLRRGINNVKHMGSYLKAQPAQHQASRLKLFLMMLKAISVSL